MKSGKISVVYCHIMIRKQQVKEKKLPATQFISWMIGQEAVIEGICGENKGVR